MKKLITLFLLVTSTLYVVGQKLIIENVNLIDVKTGKINKRTVVINEHTIEAVYKSNKIKKIGNNRLIDGTNKFLLPGLFDSHIHFFQSGGIYTRPDAIDLRKKVSYKEEIKFGKENVTDYLNRYLRLGITTVIDVGGPFTNFSVRDSIGKKMTAPNILVTGPLFSIVDRPKLGQFDPPIIKVTTKKEVDFLFYEMLPYKPDFIKIWYIANDQHPAEKSFPLVKYLGDLASKNNLKLAVHATELKTAQFAVDAGADILVHSIDDEIIPDDFVKKLKDKKITYIPTLLVGGNYYKAFAGKISDHPQDLKWANASAYGTIKDLESMAYSELPSIVKWLRINGIPKSLNKNDSISSVNLIKLVKSKINVATGTDAGNIGTFHASSYIQELEAMRKAGLSNIEILRASTINAAKGFGLSDKLGSIEKEKNADLLLLTYNPLESIQNLNSIEYVIKSGKLIKVDGILSESAEAIVQRQVNAYNARNIDAFMETYSDNIEIFGSDGKLRYKGKEKMRTSYEGFFRSTNNLYCEIQNRMVINNKVIDHEKVRINGGFSNVVAVYEVTDNKISKVTFVR